MTCHSEPHLVPLTQDHREKTYTWVQDPEFRRLFLMRGEPSWQVHKTYFNKILNDCIETWYAIMLDDVHIGNCGIKIISSALKECEIWLYIGEVSFRRKGTGAAATKLLIDKAYNDFQMNNIVVHVAGFNEPALKMYEKLGFTRTPVRPDETEWQNRGCEIIKLFL